MLGLAGIGLAVLTTSAKDPADIFIDECAKAVQALDSGSVAVHAKGDEGNFDFLLLKKGKSSRFTIVKEGAKQFEAAVGPGRGVVVDHVKKTYGARDIAVEDQQKPAAPLEPLTERRFDFRISTEYGFVLRSNPPIGNGRVAVQGDQETLTAEFLDPTNVTINGTIKLVRDAKTKYPLLLVVAAKHSLEAKFEIQKRSVTAEELAIQGASLDGYREVSIGR